MSISRSIWLRGRRANNSMQRRRRFAPPLMLRVSFTSPISGRGTDTDRYQKEGTNARR
jgi:hypothetical protein